MVYVMDVDTAEESTLPFANPERKSGALHVSAGPVTHPGVTLLPRYLSVRRVAFVVVTLRLHQAHHGLALTPTGFLR